MGSPTVARRMDEKQRPASCPSERARMEHHARIAEGRGAPWQIPMREKVGPPQLTWEVKSARVGRQ
jgi:hypothetical protein